jgi:hypothetical protein
MNEIRREKDLLELRTKELDISNRDLKEKLSESQKLIESNN